MIYATKGDTHVYVAEIFRGFEARPIADLIHTYIDPDRRATQPLQPRP